MDNIGDRQHLDSIRSPSTSSLQGAFCAEAASPNILDSFWADSELRKFGGAGSNFGRCERFGLRHFVRRLGQIGVILRSTAYNLVMIIFRLVNSL